MKKTSLIFDISFSIFHLATFVWFLIYFASAYFKFSKIDFVNEYDLGWIFYFYLTTQLLLSILIFLKGFNFFRILFEYLFLVYLSISTAYVIYMKYLFQGCIDCNFSVGVLYLDEQLICIIEIFFFLFYELLKKLALKIQVE